jgi:hypothetical protein
MVAWAAGADGVEMAAPEAVEPVVMVVLVAIRAPAVWEVMAVAFIARLH